MAKITLFSKNNCMQCKMTKKFLEKEGADFEEINIDEQPEKIDYVKSLGFTAAPVIEAGDIIFSGFQPANTSASTTKLTVLLTVKFLCIRTKKHFVPSSLKTLSQIQWHSTASQIKLII